MGRHRVGVTRGGYYAVYGECVGQTALDHISFFTGHRKKEPDHAKAP